MSIVEDEYYKYSQIWAKDYTYRIVSPFERDQLERFPKYFPNIEKTVVDFGCGCGRGSLYLAKMGYTVTMIDLTRNALDKEVSRAVDQMDNLNFIKLNFLKPTNTFGAIGDYFVCVDVIEHIPPAFEDQVLKFIYDTIDSGGIMSIATFPDVRTNGVLHLNVKPAEYWEKKMRELWPSALTLDLSENKYTGILTK